MKLWVLLDESIQEYFNYFRSNLDVADKVCAFGCQSTLCHLSLGARWSMAFVPTGSETAHIRCITDRSTVSGRIKHDVQLHDSAASNVGCTVYAIASTKTSFFPLTMNVAQRGIPEQWHSDRQGLPALCTQRTSRQHDSTRYSQGARQNHRPRGGVIYALAKFEGAGAENLCCAAQARTRSKASSQRVYELAGGLLILLELGSRGGVGSHFPPRKEYSHFVSLQFVSKGKVASTASIRNWGRGGLF